MTTEYMFDSWGGQIFLVPHLVQLWDPTSLLPIGTHFYDKAARALVTLSTSSNAVGAERWELFLHKKIKSHNGL